MSVAVCGVCCRDVVVLAHPASKATASMIGEILVFIMVISKKEDSAG
jgi:hypothetical protein